MLYIINFDKKLNNTIPLSPLTINLNLPCNPSVAAIVKQM